MKTPTIEEVREHFKDAEKVRCLYYRIPNYYNVSNSLEFKGHNNSALWTTIGKIMLWNSKKGFAEILEYKEGKYIEPTPNTKSDFKTITDSLSSLLDYKNNKYGNAALSPINVFKDKCKCGEKIDTKISRVINSKELAKNDVADLIGYLILTCKEFGWENFDEFKD